MRELIEPFDINAASEFLRHQQCGKQVDEQGGGDDADEGFEHHSS